MTLPWESWNTANTAANTAASHGMLRAHVARTPEYTVLILIGDIDLSSAQLVRDAVTRVLGEHPAHLIIDLGAVQFCAVAGLHELRWAAGRAAADGVAFHLQGADPLVRRLFDLAGAQDLIALCRPESPESPENNLADAPVEHCD
ncbi:MAG TPA: STAS domain-containing protein [Actinocrinis sp.]|jgi:stage II sporulation protein AA (anti-sigma F factor antagonist)